MPTSPSRPARAKQRRLPMRISKRPVRQSARATRRSTEQTSSCASTALTRLRSRQQRREHWSSERSIRCVAAKSIDGYASAGLEALAMEWMPRITRAQSMDILSSQSNLAGYKAVVDGAATYGRAFPMMMTAAGTISAARVFVMGVGVAGLQAIATARRLGAQVSATDVRSATKEQIQSLGAKPIFVENVAGHRGRGRGRLRDGNVGRISEGAGRAGFRPHRQAGHRHHHRVDPRPARAAPDQRRSAGDDAAGQRGRRSGGGRRRERRRLRRRAKMS